MDSGFKEHHLDPVTSKEHFGKRADVMFAYIWLNVGQESQMCHCWLELNPEEYSKERICVRSGLFGPDLIHWNINDPGIDLGWH